MAEIDDETIAKRARALAEADGFAWTLSFRHDPNCQPPPQGAFLSAERRKQYMDRARAELHKQSGNP
jgi:hypothetical protein